MLAWIFAKAMTPVGTWVAGLIFLLAAWKATGWVKYQQGYREGERVTVEAVNKKAEQINAKAREARDRAGGDGAAERMRNRWCVDCSR